MLPYILTNLLYMCMCVFYSLNPYVLYLNLNYLIYLTAPGEIFNTLKQEINLNYVQKLSSYFTVNTLHLPCLGK
jgi:hypothetical protein